MFLFSRGLVNVYIYETVPTLGHLTKGWCALFSHRTSTTTASVLHSSSHSSYSSLGFIKICVYVTFVVTENTIQIRSWHYSTLQSITGSNGCNLILWIRALSSILPSWYLVYYIISNTNDELYTIYQAFLHAFASLQNPLKIAMGRHVLNKASTAAIVPEIFLGGEGNLTIIAL